MQPGDPNGPYAGTATTPSPPMPPGYAPPAPAFPAGDASTAAAPQATTAQGPVEPAPRLHQDGGGEPEAKQRKARPKIGTYAYKLRTAHGVTVRGKVRAASSEQAATIVGQPGAEILKLKRQSDLLQMEIGPRRIKGAELVIFTRQLAAFVRSGVPMIDALGSIGGENASRQLQDTLREVSLDLAEGVPLSHAIAQHKSIFPVWYGDLVRAGETTGKLDAVLESAARYLQRQEEAKKKVRSALIYPAVIAIMAVVTVAVLLVYVLPKFVTFFKEFDAELPVLTRALLSTSAFMSTNFVWILAGLAVAVVAAAIFVRTPPGRTAWDWLKIKVPLLGIVVRYSIIERFCATLATMVSAGVPLVTTFSVVIDGARNKIFERSLRRVRDSMMIGQGMSGPIAATGLFPPIVPQMIKVGEDTGTLDEQLRMAQEFFGEELDYRLQKFTAIFEPMMIIFMGVIVGFVALAIVSAMYGIFQQVKLK